MATSSVPASRADIRVVLPGLLLAMLLAMLDTMIVSTALPTIVGDLGGLKYLSWVVTAYVLASTVSTPLWGKLGDLYGRKSFFVLSICLFLAGSALSGLAQSMGELVAFRAVQGLGAGGLLVGVLSIIGELVPPQERGRYQSYIAALSAVAMIGGPLLGGGLTDHLSWRWAFYINLPIGGVALLLIISGLHLPRNRVSHRVDYLGAALISVVATAIVLVTAWGGGQYAWSSPQIVWLSVVGVVALVATILVERRATEPILPPRLFQIRNFSLSQVLGFLVGFALYGAVTFLPLYQQNVQHASATNSGLLLLPMLAGMLVTSLFAGQAMTKTTNYRIFPVVGGAALAVGMYLLSMLGDDTSRLVSSLYMVLVGVGLGFTYQVTMVIAQNSVEVKDIGVASGSVTFFQSIGGSFAVALFGALFSSRLGDSLHASLPGTDTSTLTENAGRLDSAALQSLAGPVREAYIHGVAVATQGVFRWAIPFAVALFLLAWAVRPGPAHQTDAPTESADAVPDEAPTVAG